MKLSQIFQADSSRVSSFRVNSKPLLLLLYSIAIFVIVGNTAAYIWLHTNPMVSDDSWFFLDVFVRKISDGNLSFGDFFVKRAGLDHAQPLNKLLLYLNVVIVGMDFTYEALAGLLFAVAALWFIFLIVRREIPDEHTDPLVLLGMLAIAGIFLSLNSSGMYTWSLVTIGHYLHLLAIWLIWLSWRSLQSGRRPALLLGGVFVGLCVDDSALLIISACVTGILFVGYRLGRVRDASLVAGTLLLALLITRLFYAGLHSDVSQAGPAALPFGEVLIALRQQLPEAGRWLLIPSAQALVHVEQLMYFFPDSWKSWQLVLGLLVLAGQLWFWLAIWRARANGLVYTAVCLMLLAYGYWLGIIYGRVSVFGIDYLYQPRYVLMYLLMPVALLLLAIERLSARQVRRPEKAMLTLVIVSLIALQLPLSQATWRNAVYVDNYYQTMANQMFALARNPGAVPEKCVPVMPVCGWPEPLRAEVFRIMEKHRLNLFSREFQDRHHLYEGDAK